MHLFSWFRVIVLTHVCNSLVLLTANVEDIKRIAQKFVSESVAEKLADLIVKATGKEIDVSVENNENDGKVHDISGNEWKVNRKKDLSKHKQKSYVPKTTPSEIFHKSKDKKTRFNLKSYRDSEETIPSPKPRLKFYHAEIKHRQNPYTFNIRKRIPVIVSQDGRKDKKEIHLKDVKKGSSDGDSTNEVMKRANTLTTKRERNEFDQYGNTNYPKADVIATSGAVSLTKRPEDSKSDENKEYE